jgi:DNA-directed RNA polymerase subunit M/transcription elongation factor TFIIS
MTTETIQEAPKAVHQEDTCPKCGSEEYDILKWSWKQGVEPYADYNACCSCYHEWGDDWGLQPAGDKA